MSAHANQEQVAISRDIFSAESTPPSTGESAKSVRGTPIYPKGPDYRLEPTAQRAGEIADAFLLRLNRSDAGYLVGVLRQLGVVAELQTARIAFKAKGNILFLNLADIAAVQAEGNYVSLRHRTRPYLVHESLTSMADKLKLYGFIRIHRSVVVNTSAVEEVTPLPSGEYRLRVKSGKEYLVTRTYKHNLKHLAQLWVGSERLPG